MNQVIDMKHELSCMPNQTTATPDYMADASVLPQENIDFRYGFRLGEFGLLVPESVQSEVIMNPEIYPVPNTTDWMKGLVRVRGKLASVFDLSAMLGINGESQQNSIIVMNIKNDLVAFTFDSVHSLELPETIAEGQPKLTESISRFAGAIYQTELTYWIEFNFQSCMEQYAGQISQ